MKLTADQMKEIYDSGLPYRILFLDFDGVMNNSTIYMDDRWSHPPFKDEPELDKHPWFIPRAMQILQRLVINDGWYVVISSAWRHYITEDQASAWFGIPREKILGKTESLRNARRGEEIAFWFAEALRGGKIHPKAHLAILDDETDMCDWQIPFFVNTEWNIPEDPEAAGLNWEHYQKLQRIIYKYENGYIKMKELT